MKDRMVIDPETGAEYAALQGDPEAAQRGRIEFGRYAANLRREGKAFPSERFGVLFDGCLDSWWHGNILETLHDVYDGSDEGARGYFDDIIHGEHEYPVRFMGEASEPEMGDLERDYRYRIAAAAMFPTWKVREVVMMDEVRAATWFYERVLCNLIPGDDEELGVIADMICCLRSLRSIVEAYGCGVGRVIELLGHAVVDCGRPIQEVDEACSINWATVGWDRCDSQSA